MPAAAADYAPGTQHWTVYALLAVIAVLVALRYRKRVRELAAAQAAVRERDERVKLALAASSDGYWHYDLARDVIYSSATDIDVGAVVEREYTPDELRQRLHRDDIGKIESAVARHLSAQAREIEVEFRMQGGDRMRWLLMRGAIVERAEDGRPLRIAGSFRDVS